MKESREKKFENILICNNKLICVVTIGKTFVLRGITKECFFNDIFTIYSRD